MDVRVYLFAVGALVIISDAKKSIAANYFSTTDERRDPVTITNVTGQVPLWLQGTLIRNVQGYYEQGNDQAWHWTDGLTGMHIIKISGETITHLNKRLNTTAYQQAIATDGMPFIGYGTPAHPGPRPTGGRDPLSPFGPPSSDPDSANQKKNVLTAAKSFSAGHFSQHNGELSGKRKLLGGGGVEYAWNPGVDITRINNTCLALTDQNIYTSFDCDTGDTLQAQFYFDDSKKSQQTLSAAHWRYDPATRTHYNYLADFGIGPIDSTYTMWRWKEGSPTFEREMFGEIKTKNMSFVHSFHITEKHIVFTRSPAHYNFWDLAVKHVTPYNATFLDPTVPVGWHILDRETGQIVEEINGNSWTVNFPRLDRQTAFRGEGPGWFMTHTVNAYELPNGTIVADYCGYPDMGIFYGDYLLNLVDNPQDYMRTIEPARLVRCLIDVPGKNVECRVVLDKTFELPTFNMENHQGKPYQYAYASSAVDGVHSDFVDQLIKVDLQTGIQTAEWHDWSGGHWFVNEPVFIANPNGVSEDDGVLTCAIYDAANDVSSWLVLDAKDFTELARVHLGVKMQAHFHGKFCKSFGDMSCVGL